LLSEDVEAGELENNLDENDSKEALQFESQYDSSADNVTIVWHECSPDNSCYAE
jgi:hypothetical protein